VKQRITRHPLIAPGLPGVERPFDGRQRNKWMANPLQAGGYVLSRRADKAKRALSPHRLASSPPPPQGGRIHSAARIAVIVALGLAASASAHITGKQEEVTFSCPVARVAGTLTIPNEKTYPGKRPCVVFVGGAHAQTREGTFLRPGVPVRTDYLSFEHMLSESGFACLRYDQPGFAGSKRIRPWSGSYKDQAAVVKAAVEFARGRAEISKVMVMAEDVGGYIACLAADPEKNVPGNADAYLFLAPWCGPVDEQYDHEYGRLARLCTRESTLLEFAEQHCRVELALGRTCKPMFDAVRSGEKKYVIEDDDVSLQIDLARRREEWSMNPAEQFHRLKSPALILIGDRDQRVPLEHAKGVAESAKKTGRVKLDLVVLKNTDHFLRRATGSELDRMRDYFSYRCFKRPLQGRALDEILAFVRKSVGSK
jgi:pimeloyl-ACP methyl ester carboxylesterase